MKKNTLSSARLLQGGRDLPSRLDSVRKPRVDSRTLVEEITMLFFDTMIPQAGKHTMWMRVSCS
ncbi:MAG: hypothetical protein WB608_06080 [Terracidiphilus sp.]